MAKKQSNGKCSYCEQSFAKGGMTKHLASCKVRQTAMGEPLGEGVGKGEPRTTTIYHLQIEGAERPAYWLHIEIPGDAELDLLDGFLRAIWLECCGHLSMFQIAGQVYQSDPEAAWEFDENTMETQIDKALEPGMTFRHEYDFGTTTYLTLKVVGVREGQAVGETVQLMARNEPPELVCDQCGKPATEICPQCVWDGEGLLCKACAKKHECGPDFLLPVVNSPRAGECGYTGGEWD